MMIPTLRTLFEQADTWPVERQERLVELFEVVSGTVGDGEWTVSDEDAAEIERAMANPDEPTMSREEFRASMTDYLA